MIIRPAVTKDIDEIKRLIDILQVTRKQKDWKEKTSGLFEYPKSKEELTQALNPYFIVGETNQGIRGYSLAYDNNFFKSNYGNTEHLEWRFLLDQIKGDYLYIDQLGVLNPGSLGSGRIANALTEKEIKLARTKRLPRILAYVCEKPLPNKQSFRFLKRKGFERLIEVPIEEGIVLGLHELRL